MSIIKIFEDTEIEILPVEEYDFLLTNKQVAMGYGVNEETIRSKKSRYAEELIEGKHYFVGKKENIVTYCNESFIGRPPTLWTKRGIIRLGFLLRSSERAKRFRDWVEDLVLEELEQQQTAIIKQNELTAITASFQELNLLAQNLLNNQVQVVHEVSQIKNQFLDAAIDSIKLAELDTLKEKYVKQKCVEHNANSDHAKKAFRKSFYYKLNEYLSSNYGIKAKGQKSAQQLITNRLYYDVKDWIEKTMLGSSYRDLKDFL